MTVDAPTTLDFPVQLPVVRTRAGWLARAGERDLHLTNLHKVFWPERGYTKGDVLSYYFNVAHLLLPHVRGRPLTLRRTPDGIGGTYWYEKDVPAYAPEWLPILEAEAEGGLRTIRFATAVDVASLLWIVNLGCVELHPHHTVGAVQEFPTYAVFDLDPFAPAGFDEARYVAGLVKVVLERLGLVSFIKTSGATGLQIYVPTSGQEPYADVREAVTLLCSLIQRSDPDFATLEWEVSKRAGKVFLDANMNRAGASLVAPYSLRATWDAPVSLPLAWDELDRVDPAAATLASMRGRIEGADDPFADLPACRQTFSERVIHPR